MRISSYNEWGKLKSVVVGVATSVAIGTMIQ